MEEYIQVALQKGHVCPFTLPASDSFFRGEKGSGIRPPFYIGISETNPIKI